MRESLRLLSQNWTALGIPFETGHHTRTMFLDAKEIVVSPGVPLDIEPLSAARASRVPIISEIELAFRYLQGDIVAVTGSNGKTTTTTLIGEILKNTGRPVQVGGNIGVAMSSLVDTSTAETINVVEVSSFQLDGIRTFRPNVGVLLNITPDHLDRYAGFQAYRRSKFRLFENQKESGRCRAESRTIHRSIRRQLQCRRRFACSAVSFQWIGAPFRMEIDCFLTEVR